MNLELAERLRLLKTKALLIIKFTVERVIC